MELQHNGAENEEEESQSVSSNPLEFRTSQIEDVLNEKLEQAFNKTTAQVILHEVAKIAIEHDPIDLAHAVTRLPTSARVILYDNLPDMQAKIIFMINTGNNTRSAIFKQLDDQEIKRLIEGMPTDEAVWVLDDLSDRRLKRILDLLDQKKAARIRELQKHDRHSAGRIMTNEFFAFPMHTTIGEVVKEVHNNPGTELTGRIFVLNEE
jgi:magnesium transporter